MKESQGVKIPGWFIGLIGLAATGCGGISWAFGTFVTIRERDAIKSVFEKRLDSIEKKLDFLIERRAERDD